VVDEGEVRGDFVDTWCVNQCCWSGCSRCVMGASFVGVVVVIIVAGLVNGRCIAAVDRVIP
jgi:hypothetical protein